MRIIAGNFKGRALTCPQDELIRPTSDRLREIVFNILGCRFGGDFGSRRVLDLFAGTGALGLEALSRGAKSAVFVEQSVEGRGLIQTNIESFSLQGVVRILRRDATKLGAVGTMQPFNLVFVDPPYGKGLGEKALVSALEGRWLCPDVLVVLEESIKIKPQLPASFILADTRICGKAHVHIYQLEK